MMNELTAGISVYEIVQSLPKEICGLIGAYATSQPHVFADRPADGYNAAVGRTIRIGRRSTMTTLISGRCYTGSAVSTMPLMDTYAEFEIELLKGLYNDRIGVGVGRSTSAKYDRLSWFRFGAGAAGRWIRFRLDLASGLMYYRTNAPVSVLAGLRMPVQADWYTDPTCRLVIRFSCDMKLIVRSGFNDDRSIYAEQPCV